MTIHVGEPPLISIVTAVWNNVDTIEQCVQSVIQQTYQRIEYIVIDGNSDDGTSEILQRYADHITHYERRADEGLYHAMNRGIEVSTGDFILILNGDDWYLPEALETLVNYQAATGAEVVSAQVREVGADGNVQNRSNYRQYNHTTLLGMIFSHNVMLVPRSLYARFGFFDDTLGVQADWDFSNRLWRAGIKCSVMRQTLMCFRNTGVSSTAWDDRISDVRRIFRQQFPFMDASLLDRISDPRNWTEETCIELITLFPNRYEFCELVYDYGVRRGLINPKSAGIVLLRDLAQPSLSVIIPVYNAASTLKRSLESALKLDPDDTEIICVDDGSTDHSLSILREYSQRYSNISVLRQAKNDGVSKARNAGIEYASGSFIAFLDADDELHHEGVREAVRSARDDSADIVLGAYEVCSRSNRTRRSVRPEGAPKSGARLNDIDEFFVPAHYPGGRSARMAGEGFYSCIYRSSLVKNTRFRENLNYGEDSLFLIHILCQAKRVSWVDQKTYIIHEHADSAMGQVSEKRLLDTARWRLWASIILDCNESKTFASFLGLKYWNPALPEIARKVGLSAETIQELSTMSRQFETLFGEVPKVLSTILSEHDGISQFTKTQLKPELDSLKINILISIDSGGAALGSWRRMNALNALGHRAQIFTAIKNTDRKGILELSGPPDKRKTFVNEIMHKIWKGENCTAQELFSNFGSVLDISANNNQLFESDIIHLHWITGLLSLNNFQALATKPIIWTLADINALTGGCHYSEGCNRFVDQCQACPLLGGRSDVAEQAWIRKQAIYQQLENLTIVCPSEWVADQVRKSSLLGDRRVVVIPNAMPTDVFRPHNKVAARLKLGLPLDKKIILFGADSVTNHRKGGDILKDAMALIASQTSENFFVATFGEQSLEVPYPSKSFGRVQNFDTLAQVYSAADMFAFSSREDNAPLTVAESMLCGTPVVATNVGNVKEVVVNGKNGLICSDFSPEELAKRILQATKLFCGSEPATAQQLDVRRFVAKFHDPAQAALRHVEVYREAMGR